MLIIAFTSLGRRRNQLVSTSALRNPHAHFDRGVMEEPTIFEKFWHWRLKESPEFATAIGIHTFDEYLDNLSASAFERRVEEVTCLLGELVKEKTKCVDKQLLMNYNLLQSEIEQYQEGMKFKSFLFPLNQLEGPHIDFPRLISWMKTETVDDYRKIIARFELFPVQIDQLIELLRQGVQDNFTMAAESISSVPKMLLAVANTPIKDSRLSKPFLNFPHTIDKNEQEKLQASSEKLLSEKVFPAYLKIAKYLEKEYNPYVREKPGVGCLKGGLKYYQECLNFHTSTSLTPEEIHSIGNSEVNQIKEKMEKVMEKVGFVGNLQAFQHFLKSEPQFHFKDEADMFSTYKKIASKIKPLLCQVVKHVPSQSYVIEPVPKDVAPGYPGAYYLNPSIDGTRPGTFYLNTYKVEERSNIECVSLSLHEAEPGHHLQCCYAMEQKELPDFRRYIEDRVYYQAPGRFALNTAYLEGWGLYSEYLGEELGLYVNQYEFYGRLSHEMLRACRLVVDTGVHAMNWSRQDCIDYMTQNTAMAQTDIIAEVDRYITWPGQACAYKIGEIKIKQLRLKAQEKLGEKFDVKDFHGLILSLGAVPLKVLEEAVDKFINQA